MMRIKKNGYWDFSEEFIYPVDFDFDYKEYPTIGVNVLDLEKNSIVFGGEGIDINPVGDLDIDVVLENELAKKGETIILNLTACNNGNVNASGVKVSFVLPEELIHVSNITKQGIFNNKTGIWAINNIPGDSCVQLQIDTTVADTGSSKYTQLALLLDGSKSISSSDFNLQVEGLAKAVENPNIFPHNDKVELTVIQFGSRNVPIAELEIGPIIVNSTNADAVVKGIRDITQTPNSVSGSTPTACGLYYGADVLYKSQNNPFNNGTYPRQVILLITDGDPTGCCNGGGVYTGFRGSGCNPRDSAEKARDYLINLLKLNTKEEDQIDVIAVGNSKKFGPWLRGSIAWPEPGVYAPPFILNDPYYGWVRNASTYSEFSATIDELFGIVFNKITFTAEISSNYLTDPMSFNNKDNGFIIASSE